MFNHFLDGIFFQLFRGDVFRALQPRQPPWALLGIMVSPTDTTGQSKRIPSKGRKRMYFLRTEGETGKGGIATMAD